MANLINKSDFIGIVSFSVNIPNIDVDFHCLDAQEMDTEPIMPTAVVSGNNLIADVVEAMDESPVTRPELISLFENYIKQYMVCAAACRFLLWHGRKITQHGLRVNQEDTTTEVTDKARSEMIADIERKQNVYLARLNKALKDADYTFDGIVYQYECQTKPKAKTRIYSI